MHKPVRFSIGISILLESTFLWLHASQRVYLGFLFTSVFSCICVRKSSRVIRQILLISHDGVLVTFIAALRFPYTRYDTKKYTLCVTHATVYVFWVISSPLYPGKEALLDEEHFKCIFFNSFLFLFLFMDIS